MKKQIPTPHADPADSWLEGWTPYNPLDHAAAARGGRAPVTVPAEFTVADPVASGGDRLPQRQWTARELEADQGSNFYNAGNFDDAVRAGFRQSIVATAVGQLYEEWEYGIKANLENAFGAPAEVKVDNRDLVGKTYDEIEELENAHNDEHYRYLLIKQEEAQNDLRTSGRGGVFTQLSAGLVGGLGDSVLGIPGGAAGRAVGTAAGRAAVNAGRSAAFAVNTSRIVGGVTGFLASGTLPTIAQTYWDPNTTAADVLASTIFDGIGEAYGAFKGTRTMLRAAGMRPTPTPHLAQGNVPISQPVTPVGIPDPAEVAPVVTHPAPAPKETPKETVQEAVPEKAPEAPPVEPEVPKETPSNTPETVPEVPEVSAPDHIPEEPAVEAPPKKARKPRKQYPEDLIEIEPPEYAFRDSGILEPEVPEHAWVDAYEEPAPTPAPQRPSLPRLPEGIEDRIHAEDPTVLLQNTRYASDKRKAVKPRKKAEPVEAAAPAPANKARKPRKKVAEGSEVAFNIPDDILGEDVSLLPARELANLGIRTATRGEEVRRIPADANPAFLPEGWRDSDTGYVGDGVPLFKGTLPPESRSTSDPNSPYVDPITQAASLAAGARSIEAYAEQIDVPIDEAVRRAYTQDRAAVRHLRNAPVVAYRNLRIMGEYDLDPNLADVLSHLTEKFLGKDYILNVAINDAVHQPDSGGLAFTGTDRSGMISFRRDLPYRAAVETVVHELGHIASYAGIATVPLKLRQEAAVANRAIAKAMADPARARQAVRLRFGDGGVFSISALRNMTPGQSLLAWLGFPGPNDLKTSYWSNFDEINAHQFVRHVQREYGKALYGGKTKGRALPSEGLIMWVKETVGGMVNLFKKGLKEDADINAAMDSFFGTIAEQAEARGHLNVKGIRQATIEAIASDRGESIHLPEGIQKEVDTAAGPALPAQDPAAKIPSTPLQSLKQLAALYQSITNASGGNGNTAAGPHAASGTQAGAPAAKASQPTAPVQLSQAGQAYGLDTIPADTPEERAGVIMMDRVVSRAVKTAPTVDEVNKKGLGLTRGWIGNSRPGKLFLSASAIALQSKNPVVRWAAWALAENPGNVLGRRNNRSAAISRHIKERHILGSSLRDLRKASELWYKEQGIPIWKAMLSSDPIERFNKALQEVLYETQASGSIPSGTSPALEKAIEAAAALHDRANRIEKAAGLPGTQQTLPDPLGYMQRVLDPTKIANLTLDQKRQVIGAIEQQLLGLQFSAPVARKVAQRYLDRAEKARGGVFTPQQPTLDNVESIRTIQAILAQEGYSAQEVQDLTGPLLRQKDKHFHRKLALDENLDLGGGVTLGDLMWNDHIALLRDRARTSAGMAAMSEAGIYGYEGMRAVMAAASKGSGNMLATADELGALQQIMSEVSSIPLDERGRDYSAALEGVSAVTAVLRLGGMGFTQAAELFNVAAHIGASGTIAKLGSLGRLRRELLQSVKGVYQHDNPFLGEIEKHTGTVFGTDGYFLESPWDTNGRNRDIRGSEETSKFIRAVNVVGWAQSVAGLFRAIQSVQVRMAAEVTVEQTLNRVRTLEAPDSWLKDIGIDQDMFDRLKTDINTSVVWGPDGKARKFNASQMDADLLGDLSSTIFRSTQQMIQGTFAGERGKYIHSSFWRVATQFRSFSITAFEKQIGRQTANNGYAKAAAILVTTMGAAMPLVMLRTYVASLGRKDPDEYLKKAMSWDELINKAANYVALSGIGSDIYQAFQDFGALPSDATGINSNKLIGDRVLPAAGVVNDAYSALSGVFGNHDKLVRGIRLLPFSSMPLIVPAANSLMQALHSDKDSREAKREAKKKRQETKRKKHEEQ